MILKNIEYIVFFTLLFILIVLITKRNWEGFFNAQHGINSLDAIIYINLENRVDRKDLLMKELQKLNTNMKKVHKISGVYIPKNGHKGCVQAHILALNMIKLNNWNTVLILEDDAQLNLEPETVNNIITKSINKLNEIDPLWNVLMLSTANKIIDKKYEQFILDVDNNISLQKIIHATTSSAYIVKKSYVDKILNLFNICNNNMQHNKLSGNNFEYWALDQKWTTLQENDKWYALSREPIKQRAIWSTILQESHS